MVHRDKALLIHWMNLMMHHLGRVLASHLAEHAGIPSSIHRIWIGKSLVIIYYPIII
jgi:hypothetical protein